MGVIGIDRFEDEEWEEDGGDVLGIDCRDWSMWEVKKHAVTRYRTHFLLATFVAGSLYARLPLLLVVIGTKVVVTVGAARAAANHADGTPLALGRAIGTEAGGVGQAMAPDGNRACRAH